MITTGFGFGAQKRSLRNPMLDPVHRHRCCKEWIQVLVAGDIHWRSRCLNNVGNTQHRLATLTFAKSLCPKSKKVLPVWRKLFGLGLQADSSIGQRCSQKT